MVIRDVYPRSQSSKYKNNGHIHNGKQNHPCHNSRRQFIQGFEPYLLSDDRPALMERLLLERISLRGMGRAVSVGLPWLSRFLVQCFEALPEHVHVQPVTCTHHVMIQRLEGKALSVLLRSNRAGTLSRRTQSPHFYQGETSVH
jgi:hypothetical protein